jgi:hypothetical protein
MMMNASYDTTTERQQRRLEKMTTSMNLAQALIKMSTAKAKLRDSSSKRNKKKSQHEMIKENMANFKLNLLNTKFETDKYSKRILDSLIDKSSYDFSKNEDDIENDLSNDSELPPITPRSTNLSNNYNNNMRKSDVKLKLNDYSQTPSFQDFQKKFNQKKNYQKSINNLLTNNYLDQDSDLSIKGTNTKSHLSEKDFKSKKVCY